MDLNFYRAALQAGEFVCSAELVLGRDHTLQEVQDFVGEAAREPQGVKVISLTDLPGGNPALPPEAFVSAVLEHGLIPIAHVSGKDVNRSFLEGRFYALARLGVKNILALTGDAQKDGFLGRGKPVHDLDSVQILWLARTMASGIQYQLGSRAASSTPYQFFLGAVVNPFKQREPDMMMQLYKLELKIAAGARFIIPQLGFDIRKLYEVKQYLMRRGLGHIPVLANVYVPTATVARMMQNGELAGCSMPPDLLRRLESEKKPQRLERAALMVAAARGLGFAGAHIGGFGLAHKDFLKILDRALGIGPGWRGRLDELIHECPGQFYLFPAHPEGLSDGSGAFQVSTLRPRPALRQRASDHLHSVLIAEGSPGARFFQKRLSGHDTGWPQTVCRALLAPSAWYRKAMFGCQSCGDCIQDHLSYAGCSVQGCYKQLRNGPCGGSRPDGNCEARPQTPCLWSRVYHSSLALGRDPGRFAETLVPPRDWRLDGTNALVNRFTNRDNLSRRRRVLQVEEGEKDVHHR